MKNLMLLLALTTALMWSCGNRDNEGEAEVDDDSAAPGTETPAGDVGASAGDTKVWRLTAYGDPNSLTQVPEDMEVTLEMDLQQNLVSGKAACNNYNGRMAEASGGLGITDVSVTEVACDEATMNMQTQYIDMLRQVNNYTISGGNLVMTLGDGRQLVFGS